MKTIDTYSFSGKKVLVRVDFNVPLDKSFNITDDTRMCAAMPTISKILKDGGAVILMSHLGRPKEGPAEKYSLKHLVSHLQQLCGVPVHFIEDCIGPKAKDAASALKTGEVLLLENLRFHKEEEKGDEGFAAELASLGHVYVNDAFGTAHRAHASTTIMAKHFPNDKLFGYLLAGELANAKKVLEEAERPFTAIMGGAKVSDKILIITRLMDKVDNLVIVGGMSYTFMKAMGGKIGKSLVEEDKLDLAREVLKQAEAKGVKLYLPKDSVVADQFANDAKTAVAPSNAIEDGWMGLDIGPEAEKEFGAVIAASRTILWNGPAGVFEMSSFAHGTKTLAEAIVDATSKGAFSLIGGGDSAAAITQFGMEKQVSYVSTGGGALLEYMEGKELPGVKAILS